MDIAKVTQIKYRGVDIIQIIYMGCILWPLTVRVDPTTLTLHEKNNNTSQFDVITTEPWDIT